MANIDVYLLPRWGFICFVFKRKAKLKNTGNLLPGHGGLLDRLDGILFAVPIGVFNLFYYLNYEKKNSNFRIYWFNW